MNEEELRNLMFTASADDHGPFSIRYPRGKGVMTDWKTPLRKIKVGTGRRVRSGEDIAILGIGHLGNHALQAAEQLEADGISAAMYDMRFVKPIDETLLHEVFGKFDKVITVEDGCIQGGMGSAVLEFAADQGYTARWSVSVCRTVGSSTALRLNCTPSVATTLMTLPPLHESWLGLCIPAPKKQADRFFCLFGCPGPCELR